MLSNNNHISREIALVAVIRLRENFHVVSQFVQDPQRAIDKAINQQEEDAKGGLKPLSNRTARHQARIGLLLDIEESINLQKELNTLAVDVCAFDSEDDAKGDELLERVVETGRKTETWSAHIANCLNVIKGTQEKILHPRDLTP